MGALANCGFPKAESRVGPSGGSLRSRRWREGTDTAERRRRKLGRPPVPEVVRFEVWLVRLPSSTSDRRTPNCWMGGTAHPLRGLSPEVLVVGSGGVVLADRVAGAGAAGGVLAPGRRADSGALRHRHRLRLPSTSGRRGARSRRGRWRTWWRSRTRSRASESSMDAATERLRINSAWESISRGAATTTHHGPFRRCSRRTSAVKRGPRRACHQVAPSAMSPAPTRSHHLRRRVSRQSPISRGFSPGGGPTALPADDNKGLQPFPPRIQAPPAAPTCPFPLHRRHSGAPEATPPEKTVVHGN
jgi:hypothetical protein